MVTIRVVANTPAPASWRPCCGSCRGEGLRAFGHQWVCEDCGVLWDGSALSQAEASERGPAPPHPDMAPDSERAQRGG